MKVLAINSGSSSLKCKVVEVDGTPNSSEGVEVSIRYEGAVEEIGPAARLWLRYAGKRTEQPARAIKNHMEAVQAMWRTLKEASRAQGYALQIDAVGHRVVHGGERFRAPVVIDDAVMAIIDSVVELAPLHNPGSIAGIKGVRAVLGLQMPMVAVFDTAFHHSLPPYAATYAIDLDLAHKHGIRRYGFHGIAHESMAGMAAAALHRPLSRLKLITLQLGNGCSATAIDRGRSVDTSMGFTPLEGLVMGTRSGDLDPALVVHLSNKEGMTAEEVEHLLNERSGLLGLSGRSRDMREILAAAQGHRDPRAALAVEVFCYRVRKYIGAYLAVLGGADAIVFGGGIGERSSLIRSRICADMDWCGLRLDSARNEAAVGVPPGEAVMISPDGASLACSVAGVDEEVEIARATRRCLSQ
jgi:acetate kinase